jgi:hypothetical protein
MRDELELDSEKDTGSYDGEFTIMGADCVVYFLLTVRPRPSRQVRRTVTVTRTQAGSEDHASGHGHSDCTTSTFPA